MQIVSIKLKGLSLCNFNAEKHETNSRETLTSQKRIWPPVTQSQAVGRHTDLRAEASGSSLSTWNRSILFPSVARSPPSISLPRVTPFCLLTKSSCNWKSRFMLSFECGCLSTPPLGPYGLTELFDSKLPSVLVTKRIRLWQGGVVRSDTVTPGREVKSYQTGMGMLHSYR